MYYNYDLDEDEFFNQKIRFSVLFDIFKNNKFNLEWEIIRKKIFNYLQK